MSALDKVLNAAFTGFVWDSLREKMDDYEAARAELAALRAEVAHWKANHDDKVERLRVLTQRTDLPAEQVRRLRLLAELDDWREAGKQAAWESCAEGEKHCTCVGPLRHMLAKHDETLAKVAALEAKVKAADAFAEAWGESFECDKHRLSDPGDDCDECRRAIRSHDVVDDAEAAYRAAGDSDD